MPASSAACSRRPQGPSYRRNVTLSMTVRRMSARLSSGSWWFRSPDGRLAVWQFPNPALCLWIAAVALGRFELSATHSTALEGVRRGALLAWALDEVVRGASPFRRLLGAAVLATQIVSLIRG